MKNTIFKRLMITVLSLMLVSTTLIFAQDELVSNLTSASINKSTQELSLNEKDPVDIALNFFLQDDSELKVALPEQLKIQSALSGSLSDNPEDGTFVIEGNVLTIKGSSGVYTLLIQALYQKDDAKTLSIQSGSSIFEFNLINEELAVQPETLVVEEGNAPSLFTLFPKETNIIRSIKIVDGNGQPVDLNNPLGAGDAVQIFFTWELDPLLNVKAGDTYEFDIPAAFPIYEAIIDQELDVYGTFSIDTKGHVTMVFNALAEPGNSDDVKGVLEVHTTLDIEHIDGPSDQEIHFPIGDGIDVPISVVPKNGVDIQKDGKVPPYNGKTTKWDLVINTNKKTIKNAVLNDILPTSPDKNALVLDKNSFEVILLVVNVDGTFTESSVLVDPSEYTLSFVGENQFTLVFNHDIKDAYRIRYEADIVNAETHEGVLEFKNTASIKGDDNHSFKADDTISTQYGVHLQKANGVSVSNSASVNQSEHRIEWTVKFNYNEKLIPEALAYLEDTMQEGFIHDLGSIKIFEVSIDDKGVATRTRQLGLSEYDYLNTLIGNIHGLRIAFKSDVTKAYDIVYQTTVEPGVIIDENMVIKNVVVNGENGTDEGTGSIKQNVVDKKLVNFDVGSKNAHWNILINKDGYEMKNLVITDSFDRPEMVYELGTLEIKRVSGAAFNEGTDYDVEVVNGVLTVTFNVVITEAIEMSYDTLFALEDENDQPIASYVNTAQIQWQDGDDILHNTNDKDTLKLPALVAKNGRKVGSYNPVTKEITWIVYANYNADASSLKVNSTITDILSTIHQKIVEDSVVLYPYSLDADGKITGHPETPFPLNDVYSQSIKQTDGQTPASVTITTLKELPRAAGQIALEFKTTLEGETIDARYHNTAVFNDTLNDYPLDASLSIKEGGNIIAKNGVQDGEDINWTLNINFSRSTIENVVIMDTPSINQRLYNDSVVLYGTLLETNGSSKIDETVILEKGVDYTIEFIDDYETGQESFVIKFIGKLATINEGYILKYASRADISKDEIVSNKVVLSGENTQVVAGNDGEDILVHHSGGSGTGSGHRGQIVVTKRDEAGTPLAGAEFELYTRDGNTLWRGPALTDASGQISFGGITSNDYILKETKSPEGHILDPLFAQGVLVHVDNSNSDESLNITTQSVVNEAQSVMLTKYTSGKDKILKDTVAGAEYKLVRVNADLSEVEMGVYTTDQNGQIIVKPLSDGDYYFVETKVPVDSGMILNTQKIFFTVAIKNDGSDVAIELTAENYFGSFEMRKTDVKGNALEGVHFLLTYPDGSEKELISDASGLVSKDMLPVGSYTLKETKALDAFLVNLELIQFTIAAENEGLVTPVVLKDFLNYKGSLVLRKTDENHVALVGAEFSLMSPQGVETRVVSDSEGRVRFDELAPGSYILKETKAPEGFILDTSSRNVVIPREALGAYELDLKDLVNAPVVPEVPTLPNTGVQTQTNYGFGFLVLGMVVVVAKLERDRRRRID